MTIAHSLAQDYNIKHTVAHFLNCILLGVISLLLLSLFISFISLWLDVGWRLVKLLVTWLVFTKVI